MSNEIQPKAPRGLRRAGERTASARAERAARKEAAAWLLLAYSLGHTDDCQCAHCPGARKVAYGEGGEAAA